MSQLDSQVPSCGLAPPTLYLLHFDDHMSYNCRWVFSSGTSRFREGISQPAENEPIEGGPKMQPEHITTVSQRGLVCLVWGEIRCLETSATLTLVTTRNKPFDKAHSHYARELLELRQHWPNHEDATKEGLGSP